MRPAGPEGSNRVQAAQGGAWQRSPLRLLYIAQQCRSRGRDWTPYTDTMYMGGEFLGVSCVQFAIYEYVERRSVSYLSSCVTTCVFPAVWDI